MFLVKGVIVIYRFRFRLLLERKREFKVVLLEREIKDDGYKKGVF